MSSTNVFCVTAVITERGVWIAISIYLLIVIIKKTLKLDESLYTLSQILSLSLFERTQSLSDFIKLNCKNETPEFDGAYSLFGA